MGKIMIIKTNNPNELWIGKAASSKDQIRFYINESQYVAATEKEKGFTVKIEEDCKEVVEKKKLWQIIMEDKKYFIKVMFITLIVSTLLLSTLIFLASILHNNFLFLFLFNFILLIVRFIPVLIVEFESSEFSIKSKHSAEHMMCNFLTKNKRLPKCFDEITNSSRFSENCGTRKKIEDLVDDFVRTIISIIITVGISEIITCFYKNDMVNAVIFIILWLCSNVSIAFIMKKYNKFKFMTEPVKKMFTNLGQLGNTIPRSKVKVSDIMLAYYSAREWIKLVYPEFYDENEDVFWKVFGVKEEQLD